MPAKYQRQLRGKVKYYKVIKDDASESRQFNTKRELAMFLDKSEDCVTNYIYGKKPCDGWWIRTVYEEGNKR